MLLGRGNRAGPREIDDAKRPAPAASDSSHGRGGTLPPTPVGLTREPRLSAASRPGRRAGACRAPRPGRARGRRRTGGRPAARIVGRCRVVDRLGIVGRRDVGRRRVVGRPARDNGGDRRQVDAHRPVDPAGVGGSGGEESRGSGGGEYERAFHVRFSIICARDERACMNNALQPAGLTGSVVAQRKGTMPGVSGAAHRPRCTGSFEARGGPS